MKTKTAKRLMSLIIAATMVLALIAFIPLPVNAAGDGYTQISAGRDHTMAIDKGGSLWAWGRNDYGQLGDGTKSRDQANPKPKKIMDGVVQVSAGEGYTMAIKSDGSLWGWGSNHFGCLGDGTIDGRLSPVKIMDMDNVTQVSAGMDHTMAIDRDGGLWGWGRNYYGQLGDGTTPEWIATPKKIMDNVTQVSVGDYHTLAVKSDGSLWAWGRNGYGQLGDDTQGLNRIIPNPQKVMDGVVQVSAGKRHTLAIDREGNLWAWGSNGVGQLGDGTRTDRLSPVKIRDMDNVAQVSAGYFHTLAIKTDGSLWAWGSNEYGQLGDGTVEDRYRPKKIMDKVEQVSAGTFYTVAVKSDGSLWAWGSNEYGQIGDGTEEDRHSPVEIAGGGVVPPPPPPVSEYTVTVSSAGTGATGGGRYRQGDTVNISAGTVPQNQKFKEWTSSPGVVFADAKKPNTSFVMPAANVTVTAVFEEVAPPTPPPMSFTQNDRYSFHNGMTNFGYKYTVSNSDFEKLSNRVKSIYSASSANSIINELQAFRNKEWNGSCFGMAASSILDKSGQINVKSLVRSTASSLWQLPQPTSNSRLESAINYYQISQIIPAVKDNFDVPYGGALSLAEKSERLVENAKNGKIMLFGFRIPDMGAHAIVIVGYEPGPGGSHNVLAYDNNFPETDTIVNVSADYRTCRVEPYKDYGAVSDIRHTANFWMFDRIGIEGTDNVQGGDMAMNTQITIQAKDTTTVTNKSGQRLVYDPSADNISGTMRVISVNYIEAGMADGKALPPTLIVEVADSDSYTFETPDGGLDVSVAGPGVYASASSDQADRVVVSEYDGVSVYGSGPMEFSISLGINSDICDMVSLDGRADGEAALEFAAAGAALAYGDFTESTTLTIFSNTSEVDEISFSSPYDEVLVTKQEDEIDLMVAPGGDQVFNTSVAIGRPAGSMRNFRKANSYTSGQFGDVDENQWYGYNQGKAVANAYEYGLMRGSGAAAFNPTGAITVAEAITIAARVHSIYATGGEDFAAGEPWYRPYVDYAVKSGIIGATEFAEYGRAATRAEMAYIFSQALPAHEFAARNTVNSLPDVDGGTAYYAEIMTLYRAGVVTGSDSAGTFKPNANITRAEAAAIISRVVLPGARVSGRTYG